MNSLGIVIKSISSPSSLQSWGMALKVPTSNFTLVSFGATSTQPHPHRRSHVTSIDPGVMERGLL